ncbi:hypothetical protein [Streptomyces aquilus]|uniref:hypothetical protein n=1 Tax=Streptomyces aquilus TaxID=2548456 RepID=UPI0036B4AEDD
MVPLWPRPRPGVQGAATVAARAGAFVYAAFYTGLDAVVGIAAGPAVEHAAAGANAGPLKRPLYEVGESLGQVSAPTP